MLYIFSGAVLYQARIWRAVNRSICFMCLWLPWGDPVSLG